MIVVNMWFIKRSNGLFHYGVDYAAALGAAVREFWVRDDALAQALHQRFPAARVRILTGRGLAAAAVQAGRRGDFLFTPSSHPLAFLSRQIVVVHDVFPFLGRLGAAKLALFRLGMMLSRSNAAYINRCQGRTFLQRCGFADHRLHYLPNRLGDPATSRGEGHHSVGSPIVIGLFGTDSPKKNYDALFGAVIAAGASAVVWRLFGHANDYTDRLQADFPTLTIEIVSSDTIDLAIFLTGVDAVVSVAEDEGFARPIALALLQGVPTFLLDTPVFREFYVASAQLFATPAAVVAAVATLNPGQQLERPNLHGAGQLREDFQRGVTWLKARA